jgi:hypothetical protein
MLRCRLDAHFTVTFYLSSSNVVGAGTEKCGADVKAEENISWQNEKTKRSAHE